MKPSELFDNHYEELTEEARTVIETSDQDFDNWAGEFENAKAFNKFVPRGLGARFILSRPRTFRMTRHINIKLN